MRSKLHLLILAGVFISTCLAAKSGPPLGMVQDGQEIKNRQQQEDKLQTNLTSYAAAQQASKDIDGEDSIEASPSITSVHHQVWTSSSSGSLDELSPEMISKLRQDVPFLAAYALRPRLVGVSPPAAPSSEATRRHLIDSDLIEQNHPIESKRIVSTSLESPLIDQETHGVGSAPLRSLDSGSSSNAQPTATLGRAARQASLIPQLGDFSELNVETSSTSKSEHHHKRKTSLKRPQKKRVSAARDDSGDYFGALRTGASNSKSQGELRRRMIAEASRLIKRRQRKQSIRRNSGRRQGKSSSKNKKSKSKRKDSSRLRSESANGRLRAKNTQKLHQSRVNRLKSKLDRLNLQHHMSIIKHGRLLQQEPGSNDIADAGTKSLPHDDGVKGGAKSIGNKRPFYANGKPSSQATTTESTRGGNGLEDDTGDQSDSSPDTRRRLNGDGKDELPTTTTMTSDVPKNTIENDGATDDDDGSTSIDDDLSEPRRVGDDDVEEDGDTVMVEPKFDGVEDDPPIPTGGDDQGGSDSGGERETDTRPAVSSPSEGDDRRLAAEGDERGNRVNRERPLDSRGGEGTESNGDDAADGGNNDGANQESPSLAGGGGIGATIGGGGDAGRAGADGVEGDGDQQEDSAANGGARKSAASPGVELADEDGGDDDRGDSKKKLPPSGNGVADEDVGDIGTDGMRTKSRGGADADGSTTSSSANDDGEFGSRRSERRDNEAKSPGSTSGGNDGRDRGADDVDVDYRDDDETTTRRGASGGRPSGGKDGDKSQEEDDVEDERNRDGGANGERKSSKKQPGVDCAEDGSYKEHDEKYHDRHHQTIDWLRGSIQGEPGEDYPILSRVNGTNFNCADHKYPGYYADVESRCQEFHICQADGRQDSFLCPNGTVFSQKTLVCVWWNGFDCEATSIPDEPNNLTPTHHQTSSSPRNNNDDIQKTDAPKYYHLNALLFKSRDGNDSPQSAALPSLGQSPPVAATSGGDLRPLDVGVQMKPRRTDMRSLNENSDEVGDKSSIDDLIRAMRRERPQASSDDDEATIQRKSTDTGDDEQSAAAGPQSARLRKGGAVPRRKRRASVRQAPPKLKSRRISRNSRRRKLRHGIKPRRRA